MIACISHVCHAGAISFMTSTVSLKNGLVMGQILNHCACLRLVRPSGQGSCPVCDSGWSPAVKGSLIPGRFAKCSGTGLHGNPTDGSPGGGNSILEVGPEGLFFIASLSTMILFSTPSVRVLHFTNFLTVQQKNLDQIYIISGVLSDRYECYSKEYSCLSKTMVTHMHVTITTLKCM